MSYKITVGDIKTFLATLQPHEDAGKLGVGTSCLVARALQHKYGKSFVVGLAEYGLCAADAPLEVLPEEISAIVSQFDAIPGYRSVSRAEVEQAIPVLR